MHLNDTMPLHKGQHLRLKERIEIQKNCSATIRKYFAKAVLSPIKLYRLFISMLDDFNIYGYKKINELKDERITEEKLFIKYLGLNYKELYQKLVDYKKE